MGAFDDDDDADDEKEEEELPKTNYFVFYGEPSGDTAKITSGPVLPEEYSNWRDGAKIPIKLPEPLIYEIEPDDEGILRPYYDELGAPIMSVKLVNAFTKAGVDTLDTYDAVVREVRTGREHKYKAVNILGLVSGADRNKSEFESSGLGDGDASAVWFEKLVLDEKKLKGHLMCRLAENVGIVLVHKRVVGVVNAAKIPGAEYFGFAHPAERSG